jgi:iron complex outermembrane recepter protein
MIVSNRVKVLIAVIVQCLYTLPLYSQSQNSGELAALDLEELMNIEITSVSKKQEKLTDAPAAIYVLTNEDIRRSGATSIPEALRQVPGLYVGKINAYTWSITARGFTNQYANKLLVLIDGRSVYTPLFSGVFWDVQDVPLENIERIEVIRGPGATLWGANAVNGIINIITKKTVKDKGMLFSSGAGKEDRAFGTLQYTGTLDSQNTYRIYTKYNKYDALQSSSEGSNNNDAWEKLQTGFRIDKELTPSKHLTLQGDTYTSHSNLTFSSFDPSNQNLKLIPYTKGGNILMRYSNTLSSTSEFKIQSYFDRTIRDIGPFNEQRTTFDIDTEYRFRIGNNHDVITGLGYRNTGDNLENAPLLLTFDPIERNDNLFSGFIQDEIRLMNDTLKIIPGTKFEHNDYTGYELQPGIKILWKQDENTALWGSISRSVRTPSRADHTLTAFLGENSESNQKTGLDTRNFLFAKGNPHVVSENLIAYELGYKSEVIKDFYFDATTFVNNYSDSQSLALNPSVQSLEGTNFTYSTYPFTNIGELRAYGFEVTAAFSFSPSVKWKNNYSFSRIEVPTSGINYWYEKSLKTNYPNNSVQSILSTNLSHGIESDFILYFYDHHSAANSVVPPNLRFDTRIGYKINAHTEISLVGQNIFNSSQTESLQYLTTFPVGRNERSYYGRIIFKF